VLQSDLTLGLLLSQPILNSWGKAEEVYLEKPSVLCGDQPDGDELAK
jgi:hypothetical protein